MTMLARFLRGSLVVLSCLGLALPAHGKGAKLVEEAAPETAPGERPSVIYVTDFDLGTEAVKEKQGLLGGGDGPIRGRMRERREDRGSGANPQELVNLLATSLVADFNERGVKSERLRGDAAFPKEGWIVRGQFTEVDEGNRVRRAMIGFGSGKAEMQMHVNVADLAKSPNSPFLVFGTAADSGRMPGAIMMMNPYVAAAKFVMSKNAPAKDVKKTASKLAEAILAKGKAPPSEE
jgi:hypothetical protein